MPSAKTHQCTRCGMVSPASKFRCVSCGTWLVAPPFRMTVGRIQMVHTLALKQKGLREDEYRLRLGAYGVTTCKDFKRPQFDAFVRDLEKLPDVLLK